MSQGLQPLDQHIARLVVREGLCSVYDIRFYVEGYQLIPAENRTDFAAFLVEKGLLTDRQAARLRSIPPRPTNETTRARARAMPPPSDVTIVPPSKGKPQDSAPAPKAEDSPAPATPAPGTPTPKPRHRTPGRPHGAQGTPPTPMSAKETIRSNISARFEAQKAQSNRYLKQSATVDQLAAAGDVEQALLLHRKLKPVPLQALEHSIKSAELVNRCSVLAERRAARGNFEEALRLYDMLQELKPGNAAVAIARAHCLIRMGSMDAALEAIDYIGVRFPKHHAAVETLLRAALQEASERQSSVDEPVDDEQRARLTEAEAEFRRRLEALEREKQGLQKEKQNLQARVDGIAAQRDDLEQQLRDTEAALNEERKRTITADQFTVSAHGMDNLQRLFDQMVVRAIREKNIDDDLADDMRELVAHLLDDEREKIAERERKAQSKKIQVLEQKIRRLSTTLEETEQQRDRHQREIQHMSASGAVVLPGADVGGLEDDDPNKEHKLKLLEEIFKHNLEVREALGKKVKRRPPTSTRHPTAEELSSDSGEGTPKSPVPVKAHVSESESESEDASEQDLKSDSDTGRMDRLLMPDEDATDPDDMIWEPGMSFSSEPKDESSTVKKVSSVKSFEPPPLQR